MPSNRRSLKNFGRLVKHPALKRVVALDEGRFALISWLRRRWCRLGDRPRLPRARRGGVALALSRRGTHHRHRHLSPGFPLWRAKAWNSSCSIGATSWERQPLGSSFPVRTVLAAAR
jgi:hypothetical protein